MPSGRDIPHTGPHYPQYPPVGVRDEPEQPSHEWLENITQRMVEALEAFATLQVDKSNRVNEYRVQGLTTGGETLTTQPLLPDYQTDEIIEAIIVTGPTAGFGSYTGQGRVATPGANALIANSQLITVSGLYKVEWSVAIEAAAATVADNFNLTFAGAAIESSINPVAVGGPYAQPSVIIYIPAGNTVAVRSGVTDITGTYFADLSITPYVGDAGVPFLLQLGKRSWNLSLPPTGILAISPVNIKLGRNDNRQLSSSVAGDWSFELTGYADIPRYLRV